MPTPLTVELADQLFGARCVIELGRRGHLRRAHRRRGPRRRSTGTPSGWPPSSPHETPSLAEFLDASHSYHRHFVGLGGSPQLRDTYGALGISTLWRRAIAEQDWRTRFDVAHHAELTAACRDGDVGAGPRADP